MIVADNTFKKEYYVVVIHIYIHVDSSDNVVL